MRLLGVSERSHPETGAPRHTTYVLLRHEGPRGEREPWDKKVDGAGEDGGMLFRCWFAPLPLSVALADHQDEFLPLI